MASDDLPPGPRPRELSGRWVVIGLFAFAITLTVALWVYWKLHRAPFLQWEQFLAGEFQGSSPLVEGGQRKMHRGTPRILRITLKVDFDPQADERRAREFADLPSFGPIHPTRRVRRHPAA